MKIRLQPIYLFPLNLVIISSKSGGFFNDVAVNNESLNSSDQRELNSCCIDNSDNISRSGSINNCIQRALLSIIRVNVQYLFVIVGRCRYIAIVRISLVPAGTSHQPDKLSNYTYVYTFNYCMMLIKKEKAIFLSNSSSSLVISLWSGDPHL